MADEYTTQHLSTTCTISFGYSQFKVIEQYQILSGFLLNKIFQGICYHSTIRFVSIFVYIESFNILSDTLPAFSVTCLKILQCSVSTWVLPQANVFCRFSATVMLSILICVLAFSLKVLACPIKVNSSSRADGPTPDVGHGRSAAKERVSITRQFKF